MSQKSSTEYIIIALIVVSLLVSTLSYTSISTIAKNTKDISDLSDSIDDLSTELSEGIADISSGIDSVLTKLGEVVEPEPGPDDDDEPEPTEEIIIIIGTLDTVMNNLDPGQGGGPFRLSYNVFDPLYRLKTGNFPNADFVPCLAEDEPIISEDGLEWTIPLRRGVKFHDGTPFNASAFKFTIDRNKERDQKYGYLLDPIERIDVVDDYTIKIVLCDPYAPLKGLLLMAVTNPLSPTAVQKMSDVEFAEKPIGTGPFKYVEWAPQEHIILERNEDYWNKDMIPKVDRIIYKVYTDAATLMLALEKGDVDIVYRGIPSTDVPRMMENPDLKSIQASEKYIHWLTLNEGLPDSPLYDKRVRQAIALSIDQDEISTKIFQGLWPPVKETVFLPGFMPKPSFLPWTENVDIDRAKKLIEDAGYPDGIDITLWYTPTYICREEADLVVLIQEQLAKAGIRVSFISYEKGAFYSGMREGTWEFVLCHVSPDYPDPDSPASYIAQSTCSYAQKVHLNDTEIDELVIKGREVIDPAEREQIYGEIQDLLAEHMVYLPLVEIVTYSFYRSDLTGVESYILVQPPWWLIDKK